MYLIQNHLICTFEVLTVHQCLTVGYCISGYCITVGNIHNRRFAFVFSDVLQVWTPWVIINLPLAVFYQREREGGGEGEGGRERE